MFGCVGRLLAVAVVLASVVPVLGQAQCPDGSPAPCRSAAVAAPALTSVAVLYFDNASPDSTDDYLAEGLTEAIIAQLGQVGRISVKSRSAVRRFRGANVHDPPVIGRTLGVAYLGTGSGQGAERAVRVTIDLAHSATGTRRRSTLDSSRRWPASDWRTPCGSIGIGMRRVHLRPTACWIGVWRQRMKRCGATRPTPMLGSPGDTCSSSATPVPGTVCWRRSRGLSRSIPGTPRRGTRWAPRRR